MSILRNIIFAAASFVALNLLYWGYTQLLVLIVGWFFSMRLIIAIIVYLVFGGLIFGLANFLGSLLATLYLYVCKIATSAKFAVVWTIINVVICVSGVCLQFWPSFADVGAPGVIAGLLITLDLIIMSVVMCSNVKEQIEWRGY